MTLITDCNFLENELLDVARLFKTQPRSIVHHFRFETGVFYNDFEVDGKKYSFTDRVDKEVDELRFKRFERRFAKLRLYQILSAEYKETMPWGALTGIRPTKLAYMEQEQGKDFAGLFRQMGVREENIDLVTSPN